jgi:hypothetical protein
VTCLTWPNADISITYNSWFKASEHVSLCSFCKNVKFRQSGVFVSVELLTATFLKIRVVEYFAARMAD